MVNASSVLTGLHRSGISPLEGRNLNRPRKQWIQHKRDGRCIRWIRYPERLYGGMPPRAYMHHVKRFLAPPKRSQAPYNNRKGQVSLQAFTTKTDKKMSLRKVAFSIVI